MSTMKNATPKNQSMTVDIGLRLASITEAHQRQKALRVPMWDIWGLTLVYMTNVKYVA